MLAKKTYKNQITIPKAALKGFEGVEYFDVCTREGKIVLKPVVILEQRERIGRIREKIKALGMDEKDIDHAIQWARHRTS